MNTVGQELKKTRLEKKLKIEDVVAATKIRPFYLESMEDDDFVKLPSSVSARGFIKNYAEFLGLSPEPILAKFRRDVEAEKSKKIIPPGIVKPFSRSLIFGPGLWRTIAVIIFVIGVSFYFGKQYLTLNQEPFLAIDAPLENSLINGDKVEITGRVDSDALVLVEDNPAFVSAKGEFRYKIDLFPGENKIIIKAKSKLGKTKQKEIILYRDHY